jgi:hypothetical protein
VAKAKRTLQKTSTEELIVDGVLDVDEASEVIPFNYAITAYGADPQVDGLVKRLKEGDIFIPLFSLSEQSTNIPVRFQREYVWKKQQADRFIESLLLGLPVPGIFLVKEDTGRHLVLDGHQRLKTLSSFFNNDWEGKPFALENVQNRFKGKTYEQLDPSDRRRLNDSTIHATIVRQDQPSEDLSSIYLIFERLNSGGTSLQPQEIRVALYHGPFVELLTEVNNFHSWRALFGKKSKRLKDIELILRFFALLESSKKYARPMKGFLSGYMAHRRNLTSDQQNEFRDVFQKTTDAVRQAVGPKAFKPRKAVNAALVDALMVSVARRIKTKGEIVDHKSLRRAHHELLRNKKFQAAIAQATTDEENVRTRLDLAFRIISKVE